MRKKFTLLFAALLCVCVAWADAPIVGQRYRLKNVMTGLYMQANGGSNLLLQEQQYTLNQFFRVEQAEGNNYYLKSESGKDLYVNTSGWNAVVNSGTNTPYAITLVDGETDVYTLNQTVSDYKGCIGADAKDAGSPLYCNKGMDANGKWQFEAVPTPQVCTFNPSKTYRIKSEFSGLYMQVVNYTSGDAEGKFQLKEMSTDDGQKFSFEAATGDNEGKYYLKTVKEGTTYYVNHSSWNFVVGEEPNTPFEVALVGDHTAIYSLNQQVGGFKGNLGNDRTDKNDGKYYNIYNNISGLNGNVIWSFEEVADEIVDVTYKYMYNDQELKTETVTAIVGSDYSFNPPFGFAADTKGSVSADGGEVVVECSVNLPFEYAATADKITKWYYIQMKSNDKKYIQYLVEQDYIEWEDAEKTEGQTFEYLWAFVGDPINGFKLVNNAAGIDKAVKSTGEGNPNFAAFDDATVWKPAKSDVNGVGYFCLQYSEGIYMNAQNGKVAHWSDNDEGSTFNVVAAENVEITYNFICEIDGNEKNIGSVAVKTCIGNAYPEVVDLPFGFSVKEQLPKEKVLNAETLDLTCSVNLPFEYAKSVEDVTKWYYAQMHAHGDYGFYISATDDNMVWYGEISPEAKVVLADKIDSHLWAFVGDPIEGFKLVNYSTKEAVVIGGDAGMSAVAEATVFKADYSQAKGEWFCLKSGNQYLNLNATKANNNISQWTANDNGSSFKLTEYKEKSVEMSGVGYSTLYLDYAAYIPSGVEVYAVSEVNEGYVNLSEVTGVVPANTGVILKNVGSYTFKKAAGVEGSVDINLLEGTTTDEKVSGEAYVLANGKNGVGLYKVKLDNGSFINHANKAYLPASVVGSTAPAMFSFGRGEGTTGIKNTELTIGNVVIYDITGRRVEKMEKGIYIVNGKKVVIK